MGKTPYIGFSNETLAKLKALDPYDPILCPYCGELHLARPAQGSEGKSADLLFFECNGKSFLAGIGGKNVIGVSADVSGEL